MALCRNRCCGQIVAERNRYRPLHKTNHMYETENGPKSSLAATCLTVID
jgi:hypothetical protein